jgi:hypothetical protein
VLWLSALIGFSLQAARLEKKLSVKISELRKQPP